MLIYASRSLVTNFGTASNRLCYTIMTSTQTELKLNSKVILRLPTKGIPSPNYRAQKIQVTLLHQSDLVLSY